MQGYVQTAAFHVPREPEASEEGEAAVVDYMLVSRRSRERAGLRYQRRGIDDSANVANFVETEAIIRVDVRVRTARVSLALTGRVQREGVSNVFSYVQIRGSSAFVSCSLIRS
jgi:hypothetical protein